MYVGVTKKRQRFRADSAQDLLSKAVLLIARVSFGLSIQTLLSKYDKTQNLETVHFEKLSIRTDQPYQILLNRLESSSSSTPA